MTDTSNNTAPSATCEPTRWHRLRWRLHDWSWNRLMDRVAKQMCRFIASRDRSNYRAHALREFIAAGYDLQEATGPNRWIMDDLYQLLAVLALQGHSGGSIGYCVTAFSRLARFEPLVPLTGDPTEWYEVSDGCWQNTRCSRVFKEADGRAYDIDGRVFRGEHGAFTNRNSRVYIQFPYLPHTEYVDVTES